MHKSSDMCQYDNLNRTEHNVEKRCAGQFIFITVKVRGLLFQCTESAFMTVRFIVFTYHCVWHPHSYDKEYRRYPILENCIPFISICISPQNPVSFRLWFCQIIWKIQFKGCFYQLLIFGFELWKTMSFHTLYTLRLPLVLTPLYCQTIDMTYLQ